MKPAKFYCYYILGNIDFVIVGKVIKARTSFDAMNKFKKLLKRNGIYITAETIEQNVERL